MSFTRTLLAVLTALIILPTVASAQKQISWAVADRPDEKIEALVSRLEKYLDPLPGVEDAAGAILYHQIIVAPEEGESRLCENLVMTVRDPEGMPEELLQPRQFNADEIELVHAFVRRDGTYRRLTEAELVHVPGMEEIGRGHFEFAWGELKAGDVIGWSVVTTRESPHGYVPIRLAERIPIVIATLTSQSNGKYAYELRTNGVSLKDVSQKKNDLTDGRAMLVKASVNQREAIESVPDARPWSVDYPHMALYMKEVKVESTNQFMLPGWAKTGGWNQTLLTLGAMIDKMAEDTGGLDITLSTITTGKTTNAAKTEAVCNWVRDKITLLDGPEYQDFGRREMDKVIKSKQGTAFEKTLLMAVMLAKLEVPATIAGVRSPELGDLDRLWPTPAQFSAIVLRTVDEGAARYWAPQCGDCASGEVPDSWQGADVVTYDYETIEVAEKFQEDLQQAAMREGRLDIAGLQTELELQPWTVFETIGE